MASTTKASTPKGILVLKESSGAHLVWDAETSWHACHAVKVCIPLERTPMTFQLPNQPTERNRSPIWVRPNVVHRLACEGACLALFLLPESSEMLKLRRHTKGTHQWLSPKQGQVLLDLAKQNAEHIAQPDVLSGLLLAEWSFLMIDLIRMQRFQRVSMRG